MNIDLLFLLILILINLITVINFEKIKFFYLNLDKPDFKRKFHKRPMPLAGGIIIFFNLLLSLIYLNFNQYLVFNEFYFHDRKDLILFLISSILIFFIGFLDDRFNLSPSLKLILISIVILGLLTQDNKLSIEVVKFSFINKTINLNHYAILFTCFCFIVFINAFNMFDGINLQSSGYSLIVFFCILIFYSSSFLIYTLIISLITYSYLNFKNKSFLGDSGSLLIPFIIGYLFIKLYNFEYINFTDEVVIYMLIPGIDLIRVFFKRIKMKKSPLRPDRIHFHHLLLAKFSYSMTFIILMGMILMPILLNYLSFNKIHIIFFTILIYCFCLIILSYKKP